MEAYIFALIPLLPAFAFLLSLFLGNKSPLKGAEYPIIAIFISFVLSVIAFMQIYPGEEVIHYSVHWFGALNLGILIDPLAAVMLVMVTFVSLLIHIYAVGYMSHDAGKARYFAETALFTAAMLAVILSDNILQFFIAWELVGLCSYLLIGFWFRKPSAAAASKKAFLTTRVGDVMFLAGIIILFAEMTKLGLSDGTYLLQFKTMFAHIADIPSGKMTLITLLFFGGAVGKSGQFPLHVWLPDAMEGPTTVSALIHAATMVTAGVYLVARTFPMFIAAPNSLLIVALVGGFTAFFASTMGLVMNDLKRVLAFSTISQLGYMMLGVGTLGMVLANEAVGVSLFHLINHAFFKALLFLCAGSVIHATHLSDMRQMGGLFSKMKITGITMFIAAIALAGIPFTSGFYSKDAIIEGAYEYAIHASHTTGFIAYIPYIFGITAAFMTSIYIFRLWFMTFTGTPRTDYHAHESPASMTVPLSILAILALVFGGLTKVNFGHFLEKTFENSYIHVDLAELAALGGHSLAEGATHPPAIIFYLPIIVGVGGFIIAALIYWKKLVDLTFLTKNPLYTLLMSRYYQYQIFTETIALRLTYPIALLTDISDRHLINGIIDFISDMFIEIGEIIRKVQTGMVQNYATLFILGTAILVLFMQIRGMM